MAQGYLSQDREHLAELQRKRRSGTRRIDYMPGAEALAIFQARQAKERPGSCAATNGAVLDAILVEWAGLTGIKYSEIQRPKTLATPAGLSRLMSLAAPKLQRVRCGARRHRDGEPCRALSEPGKKRCRFHGGRSTGPRTPEGKAKCAANLPNRRAL